MFSISSFKEAYKKREYFILITLAAFALCRGGNEWYLCIIPLFLSVLFSLNNKSRDYITIGIAALFTLLALALSVFSMGNPQDGLHEAVKYACLPAGFLISEHDGRDGVLRSVFASAVILVLLCLPECVQFILQRSSEINGWFGYANVTAAYLACGIIAGVYVIRKDGLKILYIAALLIIVMVFLIMKSAASVIILAISLSSAIVFTTARTAAKNLGITVLFLAIAFAAAAVITAVFKPDMLTTVSARFSYARDALKLILLRPVIGTGISSWETLQYHVQSGDYYVREIHNGPLQMLVEGGALIILPLAGLLFFSVYKLVKNREETSVFSLAVIMFMLLHSVFDVDMNYGIMFFLAGLLLNVRCRRIKGISAAVTALLCVVVIFSAAELFFALRFENSVKKGGYEKAQAYIEKKIKLFPLDSENYKNYAVILEKNKSENREVTEQLEKASELSPYNPQYYRDMIEVCEDDVKLYVLCEKYILSAPRRKDAYTYTENAMKDSEAYEEFLAREQEIAEEYDIRLPNNILRKYLEK